MKKFVQISAIFLLLAICFFDSHQSSAQAQTDLDVMGKRFPLIRLREDYDQFGKLVNLVLTPNKPFADRQKISTLLVKQSQLLHDNMSQLEFFQIINPIVMQLHCGHTYPMLSKEYSDFLLKNGRFLPIAVKVIDKKIYVHSNLETDLPEGSEILSINGQQSGEIIQILMDSIAADGTNFTHKLNQINNSFNYYFFKFISRSSHFSITYYTPQDRQQHNTIVTAVNQEQLKNSITKYLPATEKSSTDYYGVFLNDYAILRVKTFMFTTNDLNNKYQSFLDNFFKELAGKNLRNLVLDLRNNIGGTMWSASYLYSYLIQEANPYLSCNSYSLNDTRAALIISLKQPIQPAQNNFNGNLYILINGGSFSATGTLCSLLKFHHIGKFIGEETGGSYIGMSADTMTTLKNTRIRIPNSDRRFETEVSGLTPGRGILPDYPVAPTIEDYLSGNDVEMKLTVELISKNI